MAATETTTTQPLGFQPLFKRVEQSGDFDCIFACIAMLASKPLAEVRKVAADVAKIPLQGPFWVTEDAIAKLLAHYGLVSTVYKIVNTIAELPDVAILLVEYDFETEIGRHVVFHRLKADSKKTIEYVLDPGYWIDANQQIRTDLKGLQAAWYIGVSPNYKNAGQGKK